MKLREYEGKILFKKYDIDLPKSELVEESGTREISLNFPVVLKAQVLSGDRKKHGGIVFVDDRNNLAKELDKLFSRKINGEKVEKILVEEKIEIADEYYASISYDTRIYIRNISTRDAGQLSQDQEARTKAYSKQSTEDAATKRLSQLDASQRVDADLSSRFVAPRQSSALTTDSSSRLADMDKSTFNAKGDISDIDSFRGPVLALSKTGGSGISKAKIYPLDITLSPIPEIQLRSILVEAGFTSANSHELADGQARELAGGAGSPADEMYKLSKLIQNLWKLFISEYALLAEINPIFKTKEGKLIAGDSKIILDDEKINPNERRFVEMGGDIAILASGGGASMLNIDSLLHYGGKPANYTEYSGNPKADIVKDLTRKVLGQEGINGLWVVGGTANFTDVYETMKGFLEGLESLADSIGKPAYPILVRRDGPRQKEARELVEKFAREKEYNIKFYGSELPMEKSAKMIVQLAQEYKMRKISNFEY